MHDVEHEKKWLIIHIRLSKIVTVFQLDGEISIWNKKLFIVNKYKAKGKKTLTYCIKDLILDPFAYLIILDLF